MSATTHSNAATNGHTDTDGAFWRDHTRVFLQPIAAPAILGLFGFAGATFMVATNLAGWYGNDKSGIFLFPFAAMFGGVAQFAAAMWSYRARDALATGMFGMFGSFWVAYGILNLLAATKTITLPAGKFPRTSDVLGASTCARPRFTEPTLRAVHIADKSAQIKNASTADVLYLAGLDLQCMELFC